MAHYGNPEQLELLFMNIDRRGKVKTKEKRKRLNDRKRFCFLKKPLLPWAHLVVVEKLSGRDLGQALAALSWLNRLAVTLDTSTTAAAPSTASPAAVISATAASAASTSERRVHHDGLEGVHRCRMMHVGAKVSQL